MKGIYRNIILSGVISSLMAYLTVQLLIPSVAYVQVGKLYEEFDMKKDMEKELLSTQTKGKAILDSLLVDINALTKKLEQNPGNTHLQNLVLKKREEYVDWRSSFENDQQEIVSNLQAKILAQISQYVKEYGEANGYDYVFGAVSDGTLMYGAETEDITPEVKKFINERYKGKISK
jgi:outer membrane protein